jgi:hypothetical protein
VVKRYFGALILARLKKLDTTVRQKTGKVAL